MASLLAIGGGCRRGMCPLPPKMEAFDTFRFTTVNFYCFFSVFTLNSHVDQTLLPKP